MCGANAGMGFGLSHYFVSKVADELGFTFASWAHCFVKTRRSLCECHWFMHGGQKMVVSLCL